MNVSFFNPTLAEVLGWTLVHSLWQGLVIFLLLSIGLHLFRKSSPGVRYRMGVSALLGLASWVFYTFYFYYTQMTPHIELAHMELAMDPFVFPVPEGVYETSFWTGLSGFFQEFIQVYALELAGVWLLGVGLFLIRWIGGLSYTYQLKSILSVPVIEEWQLRVDYLADQMGIKKHIPLLESARIEIPMVIGHLKPVILFPIGMISGLTPAQVEAIVAHELAHIQRRDYVVNVLLSSLEIFFFYHPIYWWISQRVADERELCCDDKAVEVTGNPRGYAEALVEMETLLQKPSFAMAFHGKKNHLLARIKRICLGENQSHRTETGKVGLTMGLLVAVGFFAWFRLPAQEEFPIMEEFTPWEEGTEWEELAELEENEFVEIPVFPFAEIEEEIIPEIAEIEMIDSRFLLELPIPGFPAVVDTPPTIIALPPMPPLPPMPSISSIPPLPPLPPMPANLEDMTQEEREEMMREFKLQYQEYEDRFKEDFQQWEENFRYQYKDWEVESSERFQEYEQKIKEYYQRYEEKLLHEDSSERYRVEAEIRRVMQEQQRAIQKEQLQLQRNLQREMQNKEREMRQQQLQLQQEMREMQRRIQEQYRNSQNRSYGSKVNYIEEAPSSGKCGEELRASMREAGFVEESKGTLDIELYEKEEQLRMRINGKPYSAKLSDKWIETLKGCGLKVAQISNIHFSHPSKGRESVQISYRENQELIDSYFDFHREMTQQLYKDKLISSLSKKWRIAHSNDKILVNGEKDTRGIGPYL